MTRKYRDKMIPIVEEAIKDSGLTKAEIHDIVPIGGSTRIPKVQEMMRKIFDDRELDHRENPDEAVALGAAIRANMLKSGDGIKDYQLTFEDLTPIDQGIKKAGGVMGVTAQDL